MPKHTPLARNLRRNQTEAEKRLWYKLRDRRFLGLKFKRQQTVEGYIGDFVCFEKRLVIELDGGQHAEMLDYDAKRTEFLEARGFLVKRYWNNDVMTNMDGVLQDITHTLEASNTLTPALSLQGEGEERIL
jgi:very-short-patch-repair endonuclease